MNKQGETEGTEVMNRGEKTREAQLDKLESIENTPEKSLVRNNLTLQRRRFIQHLIDHPTNTLGHVNYTGVSLGGTSFFNEKLAIDSAKQEFGEKVKMQFHSAEYKHYVYLRACKNLPENCTIVEGELDNLIANETEYKSNGLGRIIDKLNNRTKTFDEIWADYCMTASKEMAKSGARHISFNIKSGLYYLTMYVGCREKGGNDYKFRKLKAISGSKSNDAGEIMADLIRHYLERYGWKGRLDLVYNVRYNGGANGSSTMVTIGFAVNLPKGLITPIVENRQEVDQKRKSQLSNAVHILRHGGIEVLFKPDGRGHHKRKGKKAAVVMDAEQISLYRKIYKRWAKYTTLTTKQISVKISAELGLDSRSVSSTLAWLSPNLAKGIKNPIRKQLVEQALALRAKRMGSLKKYVATCHKIFMAA
jgi:hypothetical protein